MWPSYDIADWELVERAGAYKYFGGRWRRVRACAGRVHQPPLTLDRRQPLSEPLENGVQCRGRIRPDLRRRLRPRPLDLVGREVVAVHDLSDPEVVALLHQPTLHVVRGCFWINELFQCRALLYRLT